MLPQTNDAGVFRAAAFTITPTMNDINSQRLHLYPYDRIATATTVTAMVGAGQGLFQGIKTSSLRYLTENAHRLPRTVGGWYFYHKKKNYIMLRAGIGQGARLAVKYSLGAAGLLSAEAALDWARGTTDFLNTAVVGAACSYAYGWKKQMSPVQLFNFTRKGLAVAALIGLAQDAMIYSRGGHLWYAEVINRWTKQEKGEK